MHKAQPALQLLQRPRALSQSCYRQNHNEPKALSIIAATNELHVQGKEPLVESGSAVLLQALS